MLFKINSEEDSVVGLWSTMMAEVKASVRINSLLIPLRSITDAVEKYCLPLLFTHNHSDYDLAYSGSSLLFRHRGRNFQLATKHQLKIGKEVLDPANSCILVESYNGHHALSPNAVAKVNVDGDDLLPQDILLFEYDNLRDGYDLQSRFLSLDLDGTRALSELDMASIKMVFSLGYPTQAQGYDPDFNEDTNTVSLHVTSRVAKLIFDVNSIKSSYEENREAISVHAAYDSDIGNPDGWSGAPIFFIWGDENQNFHLGFAGMITHGNSAGNFMIYRAEDIRIVVNRVVNTPPMKL